MRPIVEAERRVAGETDVDVTSFPGEDELVVQRDAHSKSRFEFDKVFRPGSTQEEVFNGVQPLCVSVLDGFNICIFACKLVIFFSYLLFIVFLHNLIVSLHGYSLSLASFDTNIEIFVVI